MASTVADTFRQWADTVRAALPDTVRAALPATARAALPADPPRPPVLAAVVTVSGAVVVWLWRSRRRRRQPPAPRGWPLLGNVLDLTEDLHLDAVRLQERDGLGDVITLRLGWQDVIMLNSYDAIKDAFIQHGDVFMGRPMSNSFKIVDFKDDLFAKDFFHPTFKEDRAFVMTCLKNVGFGSTKSSEEKILEQIQSLFEHLSPQIRDHEPVDLENLLPKMAGNTMFQIAFNKAYDFDDPELQSRIDKVRDWLLTLFTPSVFDSAPYWLMFIFARRAVNGYRRTTAAVRDFITSEVNAHLANLDPDNPKDFIDVFLSKNTGAVNLDALRDNIFAILPDGIDTAAGALNWLVFYVTRHQDVQRRIQAEVDRAVGSGRRVTWADRPSLPYTEAVMMEVTRLVCPVNTTVFYSAVRDTTLRGYHIPKGAVLLGNLHHAMHDPETFPDPETFNPDRYMETDVSLTKSKPWIPFGMGRRKCIGEPIIKMEMFLFLANLYQRYDVTYPEGCPQPEAEIARGMISKGPKPYKVVIKQRA